MFHRKASAVPAAFSAGAGPCFHPFPIQPHPLFPLIMVESKMSTPIVMLCHAFIAAAKRDMSMLDIFDWCGAVFIGDQENCCIN